MTLENVKEKLQLFDPLIKSLFIAIKNSIFYSPDHPICAVSIESFRALLDRWFEQMDTIDLGISQDHLYLDGEPVDTDYKEIAYYLHNRGILSLTISKEVTLEELTEFLKAIRHDIKSIREGGGILKNMPPTQHITVKEIDYSSLLSSRNRKSPTDEDNIWQSLFKSTDQLTIDQLPESKVELLVEFFQDTKKSAQLLNKIYKQALHKLSDESMVHQTRSAIIKVCKYFEKINKAGDAKEFKANLMGVISQLHPDLITRLFETTDVDEKNYNLADEITSDFSDGYVAEFIESLIIGEGSINENLLRLFDKLTPDSNKANSIVTMVADKLFSKNIIGTNTLTELQTAIKEIFREHPDSDFMEQMYKITIDSVINRKIDTLTYMPRLTPLVNKFVQSVEDSKLRKESTWLYLNILWLENNPNEFKKFSEILLEQIPGLLNSKEFESLKQIMEFYLDKLRPEQKKNNRIAEIVEDTVQHITDKSTVNRLITLIPEASDENLKHISYMLSKTQNHSTKILLDTILQTKNPVFRDRFGMVISDLKTSISQEVHDRLQNCEPHLVRHLLNVLKKYVPEKAHLISRNMISNKNPQILWEALDGFTPKSEVEISKIFALLRKKKDEAIQRKAVSALLKTKSTKILQRLFRYAQRRGNDKKILINLVELCGMMEIQQSFSYLKKIFLKRSLFNTKQHDRLRLTAVKSLMKLNHRDSLQLVQKGLHDKSRIVREGCTKIINWANKNEVPLFDPEVLHESINDNSQQS